MGTVNLVNGKYSSVSGSTASLRFNVLIQGDQTDEKINETMNHSYTIVGTSSIST